MRCLPPVTLKCVLSVFFSKRVLRSAYSGPTRSPIPESIDHRFRRGRSPGRSVKLGCSVPVSPLHYWWERPSRDLGGAKEWEGQEVTGGDRPSPEWVIDPAGIGTEALQLGPVARASVSSNSGPGCARRSAPARTRWCARRSAPARPGGSRVGQLQLRPRALPRVSPARSQWCARRLAPARVRWRARRSAPARPAGRHLEALQLGPGGACVGSSSGPVEP